MKWNKCIANVINAWIVNVLENRNIDNKYVVFNDGKAPPDYLWNIIIFEYLKNKKMKTRPWAFPHIF